ncbi:hypothetical protein CSKR_201532 [Clonorchis sinensis]|uniref:Uncharacterized protein n=1 Tax=Clonorchis sinensis TaxID=79923 RepID=A0A8T1MSJ1_CLOSI|nr:hypothetical protein CSKR_201532 [Clonorchis sinensis]
MTKVLSSTQQQQQSSNMLTGWLVGSIPPAFVAGQLDQVSLRQLSATGSQPTPQQQAPLPSNTFWPLEICRHSPHFISSGNNRNALWFVLILF